MSEKAKKFLCEKLPITLVAGLLSFVLFNAIASTGFVDLVKIGNSVGVS